MQDFKPQTNKPTKSINPPTLERYGAGNEANIMPVPLTPTNLRLPPSKSFIASETINNLIKVIINLKFLSHNSDKLNNSLKGNLHFMKILSNSFFFLRGSAGL